MKIIPRIVLAALTALVAAVALPPAAIAARGTPNSPEFGYGLQLDPSGKYVVESLQSASTLKADWIAISFDWASRWPDQNSQPDLAALDSAMQIAAVHRLAVMVSLTSAPAWASTPQGPDPARVSWFVANLAQRYPETLQAVELFPAANTYQGWGASPDPVAYAQVIQATANALAGAGAPVFLAAGGLAPLPAPQPNPADMDDLQFLQMLYAAGAIQSNTLISIAFPDLTGSPLQSPDGSEHRILRHYEEVRQVMLNNNHASGLIWITRFSYPTGKISVNDVSYNGSPEGQRQWLAQAYQQIRAQLYIGVAFYNRLNPSSSGSAESSLIGANQAKHPFYADLKELIAQTRQTTPANLKFIQPQAKRIIKLRPSPP